MISIALGYVIFTSRHTLNQSLVNPFATTMQFLDFPKKEDDVEEISITPKAYWVVDYAESMVGTPYVWGAEGQKGAYDCSSWVRHVFNETVGIQLPRTAQEQAKIGEGVNRDDLQTGDLIFFKSRKRAVGHVGIYLENGKFIHNSSAKGRVGYSNLNTDSYYDSHFVKAIRILAPEKIQISFNVNKPLLTPEYLDFEKHTVENSITTGFDPLTLKYNKL